MYSRFHYILIWLIAVVIYLIYLIGYYKVQEYKTDAFMNSLKRANQQVIQRNEDKEFLSNYIRTLAYQTQVAKATQNKKLPGEEVINIVTEEEVNGNTDIDTRTAIMTTREIYDSPTKGMTNPEKWWYMISGGGN
jgi:hypothetical protein